MSHERPAARPRRLLFVENKVPNILWLKEQLEARGWEVRIIPTPHEALLYLEQQSARGDMPTIVSVDLGLASKPNEPDFGIELLERIGERWEGLPLVVHGTQVNVRRDIVRRIVAQGASYFYLDGEADAAAFLTLLPYLAEGFVVFSPLPAQELSSIVSARPDPFARFPDYWETLRLVHEGLPNSRIAQRQGMRPNGVAARLRRMAELLEDLGEIEPLDEGDVEPGGEWHRRRLSEWYRKNHLRFRPA